MPRKKRSLRYLVVAGLLVLVGGLAFVKFSQISMLIAMGAEMEKAGPPPEAVESEKAQAQDWEGTLSAVGSVAGVRSVALSNDAPGRVRRIHFESGELVKQGQVLVELDASVERADLRTAKARRELALVTAKRSRALVEERVLAQAQLDNDEATLETTETQIASLEAQIERKIVRAPFNGRLGIRNVDLGQYLAPGSTLTVLEAVGGMFVDFTLPQKHLASVKDGMPVRATLEGPEPYSASGTITAVEPAIDATTRSIRLRASVPNGDEKLRPGMFVQVSVVLPSRNRVVAVPATAVAHASYGDSVFLVEDKKPGSPGMAKTPSGKPVKVARQAFVRVGEARGDFVAIEEGLSAGQEIVSAGAFKLRNGSPIVIGAEKLDPKLDPRPPNR